MKQSANAAPIGPVVLMYHATPSGSRWNVNRFSVPAKKFTAQLDLLLDYGWHITCVKDLATGTKLPEKTVIITFDDGYADNFSGAFIPLQQRGLKATWFIVTGIIGKQADWLDGPKPERSILSLEQIQRMSAAGMEIGCHTHTHPDLTQVSQKRLKAEIHDARHLLEDAIGTKVQSFAYPFGRFNDAAVAQVEASGYQLACSTRPGWHQKHHNPMLLRRVSVYSHDTVGVFARKLYLATNNGSWSALLRYGLKRIKGKVTTKRHPR